MADETGSVAAAFGADVERAVVGLIGAFGVDVLGRGLGAKKFWN